MRHLLLLLLVACGSSRHVDSRDRFEAWMPPIPERALFTSTWGMAGHSYASLDVDTSTITRHIELYDKPVIHDTYQIDGDETAWLWELADTAWRADPPAIEEATDIRQIIVAADGDDVLWISAHGFIPPREPARELAVHLSLDGGLYR